MARPAKGKKLTLRPVRLDDDVWARCKALGKDFGTINEGLRVVLLREVKITSLTPPDKVFRGAKFSLEELRERRSREPIFDDLGLDPKPERKSTKTWRRGPRQKGDKDR